MPYRNQDERPKLAFYDRGPGPAGYILPGLIGNKKHAPTHRINPAYSMGLKLGSSFVPNNIGPGAGSYSVPTGVKANGKFIGFEYTMRQKFPLIDKKSIPAPNQYELPIPDKYRRRAPAFLFGARCPLFNRIVSPAPNTYQLPPAIGPKIPDKLAAAEVTFKGTRIEKLPEVSPGPIYDIGRPDVLKPKSPGFTMRIRWPDLSSQVYEAGPASYEANPCPCKVPPGWHFGSRYNEFTGVFRTQCDKSRYEPLD